MNPVSVVILFVIAPALFYCIVKMRRAHDEFDEIVLRDIASGGKDDK